jgi:acyl-CoA synthetase (AMP-forming)/AMP-acid ligase II
LNIVEVFEETARGCPTRTALYDKDRRFTFARLHGEVDRQAKRLRHIGFGPGVHTLVLMKNSAEFVALVFALFRIGAIPILIDPGMGLGRFLKVVEEVEPEGLVGIPKAFALKKMSPKPFKHVEHSACWGHFPEIPDLRRGSLNSEEFTAPVDPADTAAILFTSGSTGPAKGVVYTHDIFTRQVETLKRVYNFSSRDVDLPGFPLFGLFTAAMGVTAVIPDLDPSRPAQCRPFDLITQMHKYGVTSLQGSPAIWKRVVEECLSRNLTLPLIRRLITFGAPISFDFLSKWRKVAPNAKLHTPYGATEALPITDIEAEELFTTRHARNHEGKGLCVGRPLDLNEVRVVTHRKRPEKMECLPIGEVGEVGVRGAVVTQSYFKKPEATRKSKVVTPEGVWHLMGDLGYFDEQGRLWLVGRKSHLIHTDESAMYPLPGEALVVPHPEIDRAALVEGNSGPVLVVERASGSVSTEWVLRKQCLTMLRQTPKFEKVENLVFHPGMPVDPRHNAKIHREELSAWVKNLGL